MCVFAQLGAMRGLLTRVPRHQRRHHTLTA